jgi:hypothetical protein
LPGTGAFEVSRFQYTGQTKIEKSIAPVKRKIRAVAILVLVARSITHLEFLERLEI